MPRPTVPLRLLLCAVLASTGLAAWASPQSGQRDRDERRSERAPAESRERSGERRALAESVRRAERATHGQVLSAERIQYDGRDLNRVKLVDDRGRVRVYWDDPQAKRQRGGERGKPRSGDSRPRTHDDDGDSD
jgi:hypothetical protein